MSLEPENGVIRAKENTDNKHYLHSKWVLWFLKGDRQRSWEECLKKVAVLETVEDFWGLYNNIQPASGLTWGSDYYLFREGIKPMWEDPSNIKGGRWLTIIERTKRAERLDVCWLELMMALIGEQFTQVEDDICGAVVNVRQKGDKVALWTRDGTNDDTNITIGHTMRDKLSMSDSESLRYEIHKDASTRTSSIVKPRLLLPDKPKRDNSATPTPKVPTAVSS
uniref:eIF-4F 25 kDa subunit n=1 Tax=Panagrellus redivivus TaxID=6233 RepID=A0A7E4UQX0_PANRE